MCKSKIPIIHQEYKRYKNCTQCNNTTELDDQPKGQQFESTGVQFIVAPLQDTLPENEERNLVTDLQQYAPHLSSSTSKRNMAYSLET